MSLEKKGDIGIPISPCTHYGLTFGVVAVSVIEIAGAMLLGVRGIHFFCLKAPLFGVTDHAAGRPSCRSLVTGSLGGHGHNFIFGVDFLVTANA